MTVSRLYWFWFGEGERGSSGEAFVGGRSFHSQEGFCSLRFRGLQPAESMAVAIEPAE
jgi:hypothetical protein